MVMKNSVSTDMGAFMYCKQDSEQLFLEDFFLPFGGKLRADNRWVKLAALMPWDRIDEIYAQSMSR